MGAGKDGETGQSGRFDTTSRRVEWSAVPSSVRDQFETRLGSWVREAENQLGGYSPSLAARCRLGDGRRVFIKAVSREQNPKSPDSLRREINVSRQLPEG